jgi:hypothetical protein
MYNIPLVIIGVVLLCLAYLIGKKKLTWLLSGFNQHRVRDKDKLAKIVGIYNLIVGIILVTAGFINYPNTEILVPILVGGYVFLILYVQKTMVE